MHINPKTWPQLKLNDLIEINLNPGTTGPTGEADESTIPFLLQVTSSSFNDTIPLETIRIDQAASTAPFYIKNFAFVSATKVDKSVSSLKRLIQIYLKFSSFFFKLISFFEDGDARSCRIGFQRAIPQWL